MSLRFTLRQLEYFVAVGEAGSVALAARHLNVSSPSISAAIAGLEDHFGVQLFLRRHAHALTLTQAGRQLISEARAVLAAAEALNGAAADLGSEVAGPVALGTLTSLAPLILPALRRGFEARHPRVRISQRALDHAELLDGLQSGEIDLALTYDLPMPPGLVFRPIARLAPMVMLPGDHPLAGRAEMDLTELEGTPMVLLDLPHSSEYFHQILAERGISPPIAERTRDMAMLRSLVANGYGFSVVNVRTAQDTGPDGKPLAFVPIRGPAPRLRLGLARSEARPRRAVTAFAEHCAAHVAAEGLPGCVTGGNGSSPAAAQAEG